MVVKSLSSKVSLGKPKELLREMIAKRAFEIYNKRGCQTGNEWGDWLEAEKQIKNELQTDMFGKKFRK